MSNSLDALTKFKELWEYSLIIIGGKNVPLYLKYSIGEEIIKDLAEVGFLIQQANLQGQQYNRVKLAKQADLLYQKVKFNFNLLLYHKSLSDRRGHLYELETELGRMLGGWLDYLTSHGGR